MKTFVSASLAVAMIAGSLAVAAPANARDNGAAIAAGVLGGIAAGAIIASQPRPYYAPAPVYVEPPCHWERERFWDGYRWRTRRVQVCY